MAKNNQYDKEFYRSLIRELVGKINDVKRLKRIYNLTEYLYLKEDGE